MFFEIIKFIGYSFLIVLISKYVLVKLLRNIGETLSLSAKSVGDIAGFATSMPELLTVSFSAFSGLIGTSMYNIISSNIINLVQYYFSLNMSDNKSFLKNKAIKIDLILVGITIVLPIIVLIFNLEFSLNLVLLFFLFFIICYRINFRMHKNYSNKIEDEKIKLNQKNNSKKYILTIKYILYLLLTGIALYIIGNLLGNSLENLALYFNIPEIILGIALGFITSIPELITFFEAQKHHSSESNEELGVIEATNNLLFSNMLNLFIIQNIGIIIYTVVS